MHGYLIDYTISKKVKKHLLQIEDFVLNADINNVAQKVSFASPSIHRKKELKLISAAI